MSTELTAAHLQGVVRSLEFAATADETGAFASIVLDPFEGSLLKLVTTPDAITPPTPGYRIALVESNGYDLLEGLGQGRSASAVEQVPILAAGRYVNVDETDQLTLIIDNNGVPNASTVISLYTSTGVAR